MGSLVKCLRLLTLLVLTCIFIKACLDGYAKFESEETAVSTRYDDARKYRAPMIGICSHVRYESQNNFEDLLQDTNTFSFITDLSNNRTYFPNSSTKVWPDVISELDLPRRKQFLRCKKFSTLRNVKVGRKNEIFALHVSPPEVLYVSFRFFERGIFSSGLNRLYGTAFVTFQPQMDPNVTTILGFEVTQSRYRNLNIKRSPCMPPEEVTLHRSLDWCVSTYIQKNMLGCALPWLGLKKRNATAPGLRVCEGEEDFGRVMEVFAILGPLKEDDLFNLTGCLRPCHYSEFRLEKIFRLTKKGVSRTDKDIAKTITSFATLRTTVLVSEQLLLYPRDSLLADVGGYMGLLLGVSIFSLVNGLEKALAWFKKRSP